MPPEAVPPLPLDESPVVPPEPVCEVEPPVPPLLPADDGDVFAPPTHALRPRASAAADRRAERLMIPPYGGARPTPVSEMKSPTWPASAPVLVGSKFTVTTRPTPVPLLGMM